jgi:hypothetical protein
MATTPPQKPTQPKNKNATFIGRRFRSRFSVSNANFEGGYTFPVKQAQASHGDEAAQLKAHGDGGFRYFLV